MSWNTIHTFSVGEVATAANVNNNDSNLAYIPHEWDYAQITSGVSSITGTTEGTATSIITGNSVTYDGGRVQIDISSPGVSNTVSTAITYLFVLEDSTALGRIPCQAPGALVSVPLLASLFRTPSAGTHTYSLSAYVSSGSGIVGAGAGGAVTSVPAFLRVTSAKSNP